MAEQANPPAPAPAPTSALPCTVAMAPAERLVRSATFVAAAGPGGALADLGYLLLHQARLRPDGAVAGDLQFTLGLAPRERVVLTQKAWTKRNVSLEEVIGQTEETSIEYSSSFSTELGENTEHQQQEQAAQNVSASVSGGYGPVSASAGLANSASQAYTSTGQTTSRQSREETHKTADTAKKEHRITFSVQTEEGVENLSQRTIENPNTCHSLMLNIYRIHQRFKIFHELYGVRACWTPCVQDPGRDVRPKPDLLPGMTDADRMYLAEVANWVPPDLPPPATQTEYSPWSEMIHSGGIGYADDVKTTIEIPAGQVLLDLAAEHHPDTDWGTLSLPDKAGHAQPQPGATGARDVWWHVGLDICNLVYCPEPKTRIRTRFTVGPDSAGLAQYAKDLNERRVAEYQRRLKVIQDRIAADTLPGPRGGLFDPWSELMRRVIAERVEPTSYDSCAEVIRWHDAFEWENTSYELFPSWWHGKPPTGAQSRRTSFLNASWARLFVPIREGMEEQALVQIFGAQAGAAEPMKKFAADIRDYRATTFGTPGQEKVVQTAQWEEVMPTDGTYVEPVLGQCQAADEQLLALMKAERQVLEAQAKALTRPPK